LASLAIKEKKEIEKANKVRAQEFITEEEREEWYSMPTPTMQQQFDQWDQQKRGRNALTTMPLPKTDSRYTVGPDFVTDPPDPATLLRNPQVAKELGFPGGWTDNKPVRMTRKMFDPATGNVQLGPDKLVPPGTEEYAELQQRVNPITGRIRNAVNARIPKGPSEPPNPEHELRSNVFRNQTQDKGKEATFPSDQPRGYRIGDPFRQKYRT
jgi:hypothetical protein